MILLALIYILLKHSCTQYSLCRIWCNIYISSSTYPTGCMSLNSQAFFFSMSKISFHLKYFNFRSRSLFSQSQNVLLVISEGYRELETNCMKCSAQTLIVLQMNDTHRNRKHVEGYCTKLKDAIINYNWLLNHTQSEHKYSVTLSHWTRILQA